MSKKLIILILFIAGLLTGIFNISLSLDNASISLALNKSRFKSVVGHIKGIAIEEYHEMDIKPQTVLKSTKEAVLNNVSELELEFQRLN